MLLSLEVPLVKEELQLLEPLELLVVPAELVEVTLLSLTLLMPVVL